MLHTDANLFLDAITLLIHVNDDKSHKLVQEIIAISRNSNQYLAHESKLIRFYIQLAENIISTRLTVDNKGELTVLLTKFKNDPAFNDTPEVYENLREIFLSPDKFSEDNLAFIVERLQNAVLWNKSSLYTRKQFASLTRCEDTTDPTEQRRYLQNVLNAAKDLQAAHEEHAYDDDKGLIEHIDFTDVKSIKAALEKYSTRKEANTMKLGLQGLNRMFGGKGPGMGESIVFNALQHNFKSGMLMSMAKWIVKYNIPPQDPQGRKPLILFFTLENESFENLMWWFRNTYETAYNKSSEGMSQESIIDHVYNYFNEKGYVFIVERYLPSEFGYNDLVKVYEKYENSGYFIVATIIDYMNNMKKTDNAGRASNTGNYLLVRELYSNTCNFTKSKGTLLTTAHQLNRAAQQMVGQTANVVKKFNNSHMADSMDVQREVDTSIYIHIERNQMGDAYLTMKRDKRRYDNTTPDSHKYCAYKFGPYGIPDDVSSEDMSVKDIYAQADQTGGGAEAEIGSLF